MSCVFCRANWPNLDIVGRNGANSVAIVRPLNPVADGHVLVIAAEHDDNAAVDYMAALRASSLMRAAADYVRGQHLQANIITSIGASATQTVMHTHLHVVPRREGDGLLLPWSPTVEEWGFGHDADPEPDGWYTETGAGDHPRARALKASNGRTLFSRRVTPWVREAQR
ncbi:MAG: HIT family protein [Mycolicibacterium sp.]|nr:HIT family protein [Mycolicibacterium sp.]